ncbi:MAG: DUF4142 domain-containing protein [Proteobacteria bacterium]|nr:MAG: DUF4142 domain-containing protein [Pseudomonadota bacterium]
MKNALRNLTTTTICLLSLAGTANAASMGEPTMVLPKLHTINVNEIEAGNIAARRACDPEVKALGELISRDHKRLDASLKAVAQDQAVPLGEVFVNEWEQQNFNKQTAELEVLRKTRDCSLDIAFLKSMRDGHVFSGTVVEQAMNDAASGSIRDVLRDTAETIPVHYNGSVELLEKLERR